MYHAHRGARGRRPTQPSYLEIEFERGDPVAVDGEALSPGERCSRRLNEIAGAHGIGRLDLVENRFVGMKSRGVYETPGGTVLLAAHRAIESITLDRGAAHLKDELMPRYAELIYNGFWFAPERLMLQALIDQQPGARHRHASGSSSTRAACRWSAASRRTASTTTPSRPSRPTPSTTSATPRASSS